MNTFLLMANSSVVKVFKLLSSRGIFLYLQSLSGTDKGLSKEAALWCGRKELGLRWLGSSLILAPTHDVPSVFPFLGLSFPILKMKARSSRFPQFLSPELVKEMCFIKICGNLPGAGLLYPTEKGLLGRAPDAFLSSYQGWALLFLSYLTQGDKKVCPKTAELGSLRTGTWTQDRGVPEPGSCLPDTRL